MVQVIRNPLGEALAASSRDILNMIMEKRRLDIQERRLDADIVRDEANTNLNVLARLTETIPEGVTLAETPLAFREQFKRTVGVDPSVDVSIDPRFAGFGK